MGPAGRFSVKPGRQASLDSTLARTSLVKLELFIVLVSISSPSDHAEEIHAAAPSLLCFRGFVESEFPRKISPRALQILRTGAKSFWSSSIPITKRFPL